MIGEFIPQSGLVGLWHLNGNSNDSSGNGNNLTDTSITYSLANGRFGQGAGFGGSSVSQKSSSLGLTNTGVASYCVWFKRSSSAATGTLVGHTINPGSGQARTVWLAINNDTYIIFQIYTNAYYNNGASVASLGTGWHFYVVTIDGSYSRNYLDGRLQGSAVAYTNTPTDSPGTNFTLGRRPDTAADYFTGAIDEVAVFNRVLSASEIKKWWTWSKGKYL